MKCCYYDFCEFVKLNKWESDSAPNTYHIIQRNAYLISKILK